MLPPVPVMMHTLPESLPELGMRPAWRLASRFADTDADTQLRNFGEVPIDDLARFVGRFGSCLHERRGKIPIDCCRIFLAKDIDHRLGERWQLKCRRPSRFSPAIARPGSSRPASCSCAPTRKRRWKPPGTRAFAAAMRVCASGPK